MAMEEWVNVLLNFPGKKETVTFEVAVSWRGSSILLTVALARVLTPLLAHVQTENNEHGKQGQGKKKCHSNSVYSSPSYFKPVEMHLRNS